MKTKTETKAGAVPINFKLPADINQAIIDFQDQHKQTEGFHISKPAVLIRAIREGLPHIFNQQKFTLNEKDQ